MTDGIAAPVRIGLLRLSDSAPVLLAAADGLFDRYGLSARLSIEPSWANLADKLAYGLLDAAVMLPPLALVAAAGLRGVPGRLVVPMGLTLGGNAIAVSTTAADACNSAKGAMGRGRAFVAWLRTQPRPPRFAVVHHYSTHHLLLRYWLAAAGGDPDRDLEIVVVPPEQVVTSLAEQRIVGFCAGAPWGDVAQAQGAGCLLLGTSEIWAHHPEKCLAVGADWARTNPMVLEALLRALLRASAACDAPESAARLASLLAECGMEVATAALLAALPGGAGPEHIVFHRSAAWFPWRSHAAWFLAEMARWGWFAGVPDLPSLAASVYRPDLLERPARAEGLSWPESDTKQEGMHPAPWRLLAMPDAIEMLPDELFGRIV